MKKYCDLYYTTQKHVKAERNNSVPVYQYSWHIRNEKGEELESSLGNEPDEQYYDTKEVAEQQAKEAIQDHYN
jgi:hypothetical protein